MNLIPLPADRRRAEIQTHKLSAPSSHAGAIQRSAILDKAFADAAIRLVLLYGPAGHGPSTTLQQLKTLCEANGFQAGWLTLDEADNDGRRFSIYFHALIAALTGDAPADGFLPEDSSAENALRGRYD